MSPYLHFLESVWVMARERVPPGPVLQRAYGILDKFLISRTFFIKTDQKDCETRTPAEEAVDPTTATTASVAQSNEVTDSPKKKPTTVAAASTTEKVLSQRDAQNLLSSDLKEDVAQS